MNSPIHRHASALAAAAWFAALAPAVPAPEKTAPAKPGQNSAEMAFKPIAKGDYELGIHEKRLTGAEQFMPFLKTDEPFRKVEITRHFEIKATEVSWAEWKTVRKAAAKLGYTDIGKGRCGSRGSKEHNDDTHPVTLVSWLDAVLWCNLLSEVHNLTPCYHSARPFNRTTVLRSAAPGTIHVDWDANGCRLPTEAEWEAAFLFSRRYAVRGMGGVDPGKVESILRAPDGWHQNNSESRTHPVQDRPNSTSEALGLLGNVAEWCWDWKAPIKRTNPEKDPRGPETGLYRMFRGGSWADPPFCCRGSYRGDFSPDLPRSVFVGFRPVRLLADPRRSR